jgi:threonine/homoserine/homoserine lactone efflux protein
MESETMFSEFFLKGLAIGFAIAAPVGPIGMLAIRRTLADGRLAGLVTGLGAAVADATYGAIGAFGLTAVSGLLMHYSIWTRLLGGVFLCWLGIATFRAAPRANGTASVKVNHIGAFVSTMLLTLTNPLTILSFTAVFAGLGLGVGRGGYAAATIIVLGVFLGSVLWWVILSSGVSLLRHKLSEIHMKWINRTAGLILFGFGIAALSTALWR